MKRTSKKALSLFLAVVMALTSLSVGFAAFADENDPYYTLAEALKADGVVNAVWPGSASNDSITMDDPTGDIMQAAEAFWNLVASNYQNDYMGKTYSATGQYGNQFTMFGVKQQIAEVLQNGNYGVDMTVVNNALNCFIAYQNGHNEASNSMIATTIWPDHPNATNYVFTVNSSINAQLLAAKTLDDLPDTLYTSVSYSWYHDGQNTYVTTSGGWIKTYVAHRDLVWTSANRTTDGADSTTVPALKAFAAYFTDDLLAKDLTKLSSAELNTICAEGQSRIDALGNVWGNDEVMNHFFDKDAVQTFMNNAKTARDNAVAAESATEIKSLMDANDPAVMELDDLTALLSQINSLKDSLLGCSADAQAAGLAAAGTTMEDINAYIASVELAIETLEVTAAKQAIDELIATLPEDLTTVEDDNTILSALATVNTQLSVINGKSQAAIQAVFPDGTGYVTDLQNKLQIEADVRELDGDVAGFGAYFNEKLTTDLTTLDTDTLLTWRTDDNAQFTAMQEYAQEAIDRVYGEGYYAQIEAYIASIDTTLRARVEAQIDEAVDNYDEYGAITILNYKDVQSAIGGVETSIIDAVGLTDEYQAKYDQFGTILDEYNEFVDTKGVSGWITPDVDYPVREQMAGDMARTADETYAVTSDKLEQVISSIDQLMGNSQFSDLLGLDQVLTDLVAAQLQGTLYTDETVNNVMVTVYSMIIDNLKDLQLVNESIMGVDINITGQLLLDNFYQFGLDVYPTTLVDHVNQYVTDGSHPEWADVVTALNSVENNWANYDVATSWGVHDQASFVDALGVALSGLDPVLKAALTSQNMEESGTVISVAKVDINMQAMSLYDRAILPLMEALGCTGMVDAATYNTYTQGKELIGNILNPLLTWVTDTLAANPMSTILDILPKIAYIMEFDMITETLQATPASLDIDISANIITTIHITTLHMFDGSLIPELKGDNLYELLTNILPMFGMEGLDLSMLSDINKLLAFVFSQVAPDSNLVLPTIDQAYLASLGTLNTGVASGRTSGTRTEYVTDKPATLLAVLRYVLPMLADEDFVDSLLALIGQLAGSEITLSDDIMTILKGLGSNPDGVICALTELFVPQEYASKELNYSNTNMVGEQINPVTYSDDWTKEQAQYISDNLSDFVNDMMVILGGEDMPTLGEMIRSYIADQFYTNETINSLILMIKEQLDSVGIDLAPFLALVNVDLSLWDNVTEDTDWGVIPGDTETFKAALKEALSPFAPIMATLMSGEVDLTILGTVTMKSYPGYQNGIIPILEALGCADEDIMSAEEYANLAASGDYDQMISAIIDPILNLVDEIYDDPINKLLEILPNAFYFINNGNLQIAVENALQSVFVLLDTVRPIYNLSFDLNLDVQQIALEMIENLEVNGQKLNLKIPFVTDLNMLAVGTVTEYTSKSGKTAYKLTDTDQADFITVLMRNIVELIFYEDNLDTIVNLIGSYANMSAEDLDTLKDILYTFAEMYHEDNGVDKILNAIYFIFKGMHQTGNGAITVVGGLNERWSAIFEAFYNSGNPALVELAKAADEILDFLSFGFINGGGVGTAGLVDFADRVLAFFQGRVTDVSINQTEASLYEGQSVSLSLSFKPVTVKNKNAVWTTSNANVATVENGVVTAVGPGDAEITATTEDGGLEVSCVVRVRADKTALNEMIAFVTSTDLTEDQLALVNDALTNAQTVADKELASQADVDAAAAALLEAFRALDLGGAITSVVITQNGQPVGDTVYQKVSWTKQWNSTPASLGLQINEDANVRSITWEYANWSVDDPEADIEAADDGMSALIRAKNSVVGAHSCWIQVTVEDVYGNTVTSDPVKVRFYNWDWQK